MDQINTGQQKGASNHGNRIYVQVLLEQSRGELFLNDALKAGVKPSAWMRQLIYDYLKTKYPDLEPLAAEKDREQWQQAIKARIKGRALKRQADLAQKNSQTQT